MPDDIAQKSEDKTSGNMVSREELIARTFEALRGVVLHDWVDASMSEKRTQAVRALANKYTVKVEAGTR